MSPVASSTTFASRALVLSHCNCVYDDPDIALLGSNWYVQALRYQKELVNIITSDQGSTFSISYSSDQGSNNIVAGQDDSTSASSSSSSADDGNTTPIQDLIQWAESSSLLMDPPVPPVDQNLACCFPSTKYSSARPSPGRGPAAYRSGFNRTLFHSFRGMIALQASTTRKKTFLNEPEWKTVPWEHAPSEKRIPDYFIDFALELPECHEIIDQVMMYAFGNDKADPDNDDDQAGPAEQTPRLRRQYRTHEVWLELRLVHQKLNDLEVRIEKWFEDYSRDAREYAFEHLHLPPSASFDLATAAPNNSQPRCPNMTSDSGFACTHFFKPAVKYSTLHDARLVTLYHGISIGDRVPARLDSPMRIS
ncbi:hypothetical protein V1517DRAFT_337508 [Lipomyces orientalis]|uniref:Uncharacterized protein n=1 Tax=Lipomyces orientalis TaxID=1233043 RepID=A0ACC3TT09_9ASCO